MRSTASGRRPSPRRCNPFREQALGEAAMTHTTASDQDAITLRPRKASREGIPTLAETLALSFYDDPVFTWCIPNDVRRRELLPDFFTAVVESYMKYDEIYDVPAGVSAAVWASPGAEDDEQLPERIGEILQENAERAFVALGLMAEIHPTDAHHYLFVVGTRPGWQGRGIGSAVMSPVLETCDHDVVPAYLEATSE